MITERLKEIIGRQIHNFDDCKGKSIKSVYRGFENFVIAFNDDSFIHISSVTDYDGHRELDVYQEPDLYSLQEVDLITESEYKLEVKVQQEQTRKKTQKKERYELARLIEKYGVEK